MIYRIVFALLATKAAGFAAFHDHDHDDDAKMRGDHHDDHCPEPDPWARMVGAMPPEFTPGIQSGADFYAGVTIARIKPYMHDRLEKCVLTSSVYEPADFNPCTADPNEECSCFNVMRHFRTHPNATGVVYSTRSSTTVHHRNGHLESEEAWATSTILRGGSLRSRSSARSPPRFLVARWGERRGLPDVRRAGGLPDLGGHGASRRSAPRPATTAAPLQPRLAPADRQRDGLRHFMQIMRRLGRPRRAARSAVGRRNPRRRGGHGRPRAPTTARRT